MAATDEERSHSDEIREIWKLFRETDRRFKETEKMLVTESKEMNRKFDETNRRFKETEKMIVKESKETDRLFKESADQLKATQKKVEALIGKCTLYAEMLVSPSGIRMFRERGVNVEWASQKVTVHRGGEEMTIAALFVSYEDILPIMIRSTLSVDDVNEHIERLRIFKRFFPEYKDKNVLGAVAGIVFNGNSDKFAYKQGLFVIGQTGDTVHILNDEQFKPRAW